MPRYQNRKYNTKLNQTPLSIRLDTMEVGDYFEVKGDLQLMRVNVSAWGRRHKKTFSVYRDGLRHICQRIT